MVAYALDADWTISMGEPELKRMTAAEFLATEFFDSIDAIVDLPAIECRLTARDIFEGLPFAA